jgi:hypothetical protein
LPRDTGRKIHDKKPWLIGFERELIPAEGIAPGTEIVVGWSVFPHSEVSGRIAFAALFKVPQLLPCQLVFLHLKTKTILGHTHVSATHGAIWTGRRSSFERMLRLSIWLQ